MAADLDPIDAIERWRAQNTAPVDAVGLAVVEALARRAQAHQGEARELLMQRIDERLAQLATARLPTPQADAAPRAPEVRRTVLTGLSELIDRLGRPTAQRSSPPPSPRKGPVRQNAAPVTVPVSDTTSSEPRNAVTAFKDTWSRLRAAQRLRQSLAQVPAMAGPLNSSHVMNRTLQAMHDLSPEYLDAFMLHVDTLLWLEQATGGALPLRAAAPAGEGRGIAGRPTRKG